MCDLAMKAIPLGIKAAFPPVPTLPALTDMRKSFWPIDQVLNDVEFGELLFIGGVPVMEDWAGIGDIGPCLRAWSDCFERIGRRIAIDLDLGHLRRLASRLEAGMLLEVSDVERARRLVDRCKSVYLACPNTLRKYAVTEEEIAIALDEYGLRRAA